MTINPLAIQLQQQPPLFDVVTVDASQTYANQLVVTGGTFPYTFQTVQGSSYLTVYPSGAVAASAVMPRGTYVVSGTVFDNHGNIGQWIFTLQVTAGPSSPMTQVTPIVAALPTGVEMKVPFQIDSATGGVAYLFDYNQIVAQHVETICLTMVGERLMIPLYGTPLEAQLFEPMIEATNALIASDIEKALSTLEPRIHVMSVQVGTDNPFSGVLTVTITYRVMPFKDWNRLQITTGGTITQVNTS